MEKLLAKWVPDFGDTKRYPISYALTGKLRNVYCDYVEKIDHAFTGRHCHDDVIKWKHFPRNWPFVREIHRSPVNFLHKGQWRGALMFTLIYAWINDWVNNREAGDLRRQHGHYDVIVMVLQSSFTETVVISSMFWTFYNSSMLTNESHYSFFQAYGWATGHILF